VKAIPRCGERLFSLHTNTALKALHMHFNMTESHALAIRVGVLSHLRENKSLETLSMTSEYTTFDDYLVCVAAIHPNTTLKSLRLLPLHGADFCVDQDEANGLVATVLKNKYGLEDFSGIPHGPGDITSILQLNAAGRRYLVQDGFSISKGVDVLSVVCDLVITSTLCSCICWRIQDFVTEALSKLRIARRVQ
jgi:hypothetical protein